MYRDLTAVIIREWKISIKSSRMMIQAFIQPLIYYLLFIPVIAKSIGFVSYNNMTVPYELFVLPGIIIFNSFVAGQYTGISTYIDKLSGELEVLFTLPVRRSALLAGKVFSSSIRTILQSIILFIIAYIKTDIKSHDYKIYFLLLCIAIVFSAISVLLFSGLSSLIKSQGAFNIVVNIVVMPVIFTSTVFYSEKSFPRLLSYVARFNPLSIATNLMRDIMFNVDGNIIFHNIMYLLVMVIVSYMFAIITYDRSFK